MTIATPTFPADRSDEFTSLFLHKLRHDLINSVRPLVEIPNWIEEDIAEADITLPEAIRENFGMLGKHSLRLLRMIEDLLTYAHINQHGDSDDLTLNDRLQRLVKGTLPPEFRLISELPNNMLPIQSADAETLLDALLSNAVKHHDRPSGKIQVTCKKIGAATQLTVADDGPGIDPKYLEKIFDPLTTLSSRDQIEGSGMGLAIVRRIASINGGYTKAISAQGQRGTCIVVRFP